MAVVKLDKLPLPVRTVLLWLGSAVIGSIALAVLCVMVNVWIVMAIKDEAKS